MLLVLLVPLYRADPATGLASEHPLPCHRGRRLALVVSPWVVYNLSRFDKRVTISTGLGQTLLAANCSDTYLGP